MLLHGTHIHQVIQCLALVCCNEALFIIMSKYVSKEGKVLLKNTIQSLNFQNKKLEEDLMWKRHSSQNDYSDNEILPAKRRRVDPSEERTTTDTSSHKSTAKYWTQKLLKEENKHSERWGHSGYQELYPDEFEGPHSEVSSSSSKSNSKKHKSKKKKKSKKHKKHKHKKNF